MCARYICTRTKHFIKDFRSVVTFISSRPDASKRGRCHNNNNIKFVNSKLVTRSFYEREENVCKWKRERRRILWHESYYNILFSLLERVLMFIYVLTFIRTRPLNAAIPIHLYIITNTRNKKIKNRSCLFIFVMHFPCVRTPNELLCTYDETRVHARPRVLNRSQIFLLRRSASHPHLFKRMYMYVKNLTTRSRKIFDFNNYYFQRSLNVLLNRQIRTLFAFHSWPSILAVSSTKWGRDYSVGRLKNSDLKIRQFFVFCFNWTAYFNSDNRTYLSRCTKNECNIC